MTDEIKEISENVVAGRNAVLELLKSGRDIDKIFIKDGEWEGSIKKIAAEARSRGIPAVTAEHIKKGDTVVDGAGKGAAGVVARVTILPCFTEVYRPESGALVCVAEEGYRDITVTVRAAAKRTKAGLQAGTLPLLCGKTVFLHLPSLCGEGVILSVTAP